MIDTCLYGHFNFSGYQEHHRNVCKKLFGIISWILHLTPSNSKVKELGTYIYMCLITGGVERKAIFVEIL